MTNTNSNERLYQIAITMLPNIGSVLAKNLIAYYGSAEGVFKTPKLDIEKTPLKGVERVIGVEKSGILHEAEKELKFIEDYKIKTLFLTDKDYPRRLIECRDSPVLLYYKGNADLNVERIVGIVGTRAATEYGKEVTKKLVAELASLNILIVSGLAYGIDVTAHNAALENNLNTIGVLGHGLKTISPSKHKVVAAKMVAKGGLLTEFVSTDVGLAENFPRRNRVIAGLCDAIVVVESAIDGGGLITANIAYSYNRDVFAFPGKTNDKMSVGCNFLIKSNKATMIENGKDLLQAMNWDEEELSGKPGKQPRQLLLNLSEDEQKIYNLLNEKGEVEIDRLSSETGINASSLAATILEMEMNNIIASLPGKRFKLI